MDHLRHETPANKSAQPDARAARGWLQLLDARNEPEEATDILRCSYGPSWLSDYVYTIRSGQVKLVHYLPNGSYRIIRLLQKGDLAGIEALNGSAYLHHAIAMQAVTVCRIPVVTIDELNNRSPCLYKQLTARWQKVQSDAEVWLADLNMGSSKKRVANLLIYLANHHSDDETFNLPSRYDIGALLAITTETTSRIIADFKRSGILQTNKNVARINLAKLKSIQ